MHNGPGKDSNLLKYEFFKSKGLLNPKEVDLLEEAMLEARSSSQEKKAGNLNKSAEHLAKLRQLMRPYGTEATTKLTKFTEQYGEYAKFTTVQRASAEQDLNKKKSDLDEIKRKGEAARSELKQLNSEREESVKTLNELKKEQKEVLSRDVKNLNEKLKSLVVEKPQTPTATPTNTRNDPSKRT